MHANCKAHLDIFHMEFALYKFIIIIIIIFTRNLEFRRCSLALEFRGIIRRAREYDLRECIPHTWVCSTLNYSKMYF